MSRDDTWDKVLEGHHCEAGSELRPTNQVVCWQLAGVDTLWGQERSWSLLGFPPWGPCQAGHAETASCSRVTGKLEVKEAE